MKGYSISSLTPCSISTSNVLSSFTSLWWRTHQRKHVLWSGLHKWSKWYVFFSLIALVLDRFWQKCKLSVKKWYQNTCRSDNLLDVGTLVTHHLLSHLEATRPELRRPHLLPAVTLPLTGSFFGYRLVTNNLRDKKQGGSQRRNQQFVMWRRVTTVRISSDPFHFSDFLLTSTKFPEYTSSSVTSRSSMMSFPRGMFLSCCCRFPPNMNPKSPKKLQKEDRVGAKKII